MTTDQNPRPTEYARSNVVTSFSAPSGRGRRWSPGSLTRWGPTPGRPTSSTSPVSGIPPATSSDRISPRSTNGSPPRQVVRTAPRERPRRSPRPLSQPTFHSLDLDWIRCPGSIAAKDPRFSFTLLAWLRHGAFADRDVRLILTGREATGMIRSALSHYDVKHHCGNTTEGARQTLAAYSAGAEWHVDATGLPCLRVDYETLDQRPEQAVEELAEFMDISDAELVARARAVCAPGRSRADRSAEAPPDAESIGSFGRGALHRQREQRCSS